MNDRQARAIAAAAVQPAFLDAVAWLQSITETIVKNSREGRGADAQVAYERDRLAALDAFLTSARDAGHEPAPGRRAS